MKVEWLTVFLASCLISISCFCGQQRLCADNSNAQSVSHVGAAEPTRAEWEDSGLDLAQWADAVGDKKLASFIRNWPLPDEVTQVDAQIIACIDKNTDSP
ncbi:MAG: hypothetical protein HOB45_12880, partial [Planctomycetaceae bacterium]|nr:hypothetical protein [Planctomycetaceae bacterium]